MESVCSGRISHSCTFDYLSEEPWSRTYVMLMIVFAYVLPLSVITCCYTLIFTYVSGHDTMLRDRKPGKQTEDSIRRRETQLARVVIISVFFWTMAWTPYATISVLGLTSRQEVLTPTTTMIPALFAKLSTVYNPLIYAVSHPSYRQEIARRLPWLCSRIGLSAKDSTHLSVTSIITRGEPISRASFRKVKAASLKHSTLLITKQSLREVKSTDV
ncbi:hypothetical protein Pmani_000012 [Petrolisthes manimaculis]|uniref:G-protein coupled receptors family 1 profile domain-containing protein n=1 Tax=Petrolisthes manimaculis TaxID=1843537 RepID=A0AAE1UTF5_9EUCA|nr:hypothetical protein Pmani_000012 [Petrolisthes manimaculis]